MINYKYTLSLIGNFLQGAISGAAFALVICLLLEFGSVSESAMCKDIRAFEPELMATATYLKHCKEGENGSTN